MKASIWAAVSPMRAAAPSAGMMVISTPAGPVGEVYRLWVEGGDDWTRVRVRAEDCPRIEASFLKAERARLGDALFRQEYEAEFVAATRGVFDAAALAQMFGDVPGDESDAAKAIEQEDARMDRIARAAAAAARRGRRPRHSCEERQMPHPSMRTGRQRGADSEHVAVIAGGGPNQPRVLLDATAGWVRDPYGGGSVRQRPDARLPPGEARIDPADDGRRGHEREPPAAVGDADADGARRPPLRAHRRRDGQ